MSSGRWHFAVTDPNGLGKLRLCGNVVEQSSRPRPSGSLGSKAHPSRAGRAVGAHRAPGVGRRASGSLRCGVLG